jgi:hypothetical protein
MLNNKTNLKYILDIKGDVHSIKLMDHFLNNINLEKVIVGVPTRRKFITILRSPFVNKTSREQYSQKLHKIRVIINIDDKKISSLIFENLLNIQLYKFSNRLTYRIHKELNSNTF